jgi:hypothetical protein
MKRIALFLSLATLAMGMVSCGGSTEKKSTETAKVEVAETAKVTVYYFHGKQRCKTCIGVQKVAEEAISEKFGGNDEVKFVEVDFSESANAALADKYEISFSSLVVATDAEHIDITEFAFANALSNPDTLKETLTSEVNIFLTK